MKKSEVRKIYLSEISKYHYPKKDFIVKCRVKDLVSEIEKAVK